MFEMFVDLGYYFIYVHWFTRNKKQKLFSKQFIGIHSIKIQ